MKLLRFFVLYPLSLFYGFVTSVRNFLYDVKFFKSHEFDLPVISVGNITVGGTGKTPMTEFLIQFLKDEYKPAVLSRGYKRKTRGFRLVETDSLVREVGDEPLQMKQKFPDVVVAVDAKRVRGIKQIMQQFPDVSVILLDDAFQHRKVKPGFSILLSDYGRSMLDDYFLPYGRLRESLSQLHRAHIIIITKTPEDIKPIDMRIMAENLKIKPYQTLYFSALEYDALKPVFPGENPAKSLDDIKHEKSGILMLTGIANPLPLESFLKKTAADLSTIHFPDHHDFTAGNIRKVEKQFNDIVHDKKYIITTEKDALRLRVVEDMISDDIKAVMFYIPVKVKFISPPLQEFHKQMHDHIKTSTSNNKFFAARRDF